MSLVFGFVSGLRLCLAFESLGLGCLLLLGLALGGLFFNGGFGFRGVFSCDYVGGVLCALGFLVYGLCGRGTCLA